MFGGGVFLGIIGQVYGKDVVKKINTRFKKEYKGKYEELDLKKKIANEILAELRKGE